MIGPRIQTNTVTDSQTTDDLDTVEIFHVDETPTTTVKLCANCRGAESVVSLCLDCYVRVRQ